MDGGDNNAKAYTVNATLGVVLCVHTATMVVGNQADNKQALAQVALFLPFPQ